jgi:hypothetical protein
MFVVPAQSLLQRYILCDKKKMTEVAKVTIPLVPSDILEVISFPVHTWLVTAIMEYYTIFFPEKWLY